MNDQTQHNHPPRCCCHYSAEAITSDDVTVCPMCIEHGELARLAEWTPEYPGQPEPQCPSCHTTAGHPHTDYCRHADTRHLVSEHLGGTKPSTENRDYPGQPATPETAEDRSNRFWQGTALESDPTSDPEDYRNETFAG